MRFEFSNPVFEWRGPSPFYFVALSPEVSAEVKEVGPAVTFGYGMIPGVATIGRSDFTTALFPRDGVYLLPLRKAVREAEEIVTGKIVSGSLIVGI